MFRLVFLSFYTDRINFLQRFKRNCRKGSLIKRSFLNNLRYATFIIENFFEFTSTVEELISLFLNPFIESVLLDSIFQCQLYYIFEIIEPSKFFNIVLIAQNRILFCHSRLLILKAVNVSFYLGTSHRLKPVHEMKKPLFIILITIG